MVGQQVPFSLLDCSGAEEQDRGLEVEWDPLGGVVFLAVASPLIAEVLEEVWEAVLEELQEVLGSPQSAQMLQDHSYHFENEAVD